MSREMTVTGQEQMFEDSEIIVSKTDLKGIITYANDVFINVSGYSEGELLGKPHNIVRHPDMPAAVFKLLWDTIQKGEEIFAYVVNRCKNGDHYWVYAHVTPWVGGDGSILGYHSNRRVPRRDILDQAIIPLYRKMREAELRGGTNRPDMAAAAKILTDTVAQMGHANYEEMIHKMFWEPPFGKGGR